MSTGAPRGFTGRHMSAILIAFFGVVIAVNVMMARLAIGTFGGVVVENSYVASQHFNRWLDEAASERALGWEAQARRQQDGRVAVRLIRVPTGSVLLTGIARHPLGRLADRTLRFLPARDGSYVSATALPPGRWRLHLDIRANGRQWRHEGDIS